MRVLLPTVSLIALLLTSTVSCSHQRKADGDKEENLIVNGSFEDGPDVRQLPAAGCGRHGHPRLDCHARTN